MREKYSFQDIPLKEFTTTFTKLKNECDSNQTTQFNIKTEEDDTMELSDEFFEHNEDR